MPSRIELCNTSDVDVGGALRCEKTTDPRGVQRRRRVLCDRRRLHPWAGLVVGRLCRRRRRQCNFHNGQFNIRTGEVVFLDSQTAAHVHVGGCCNLNSSRHQLVSDGIWRLMGQPRDATLRMSAVRQPQQHLRPCTSATPFPSVVVRSPCCDRGEQDRAANGQRHGSTHQRLSLQRDMALVVQHDDKGVDALHVKHGVGTETGGRCNCARSTAASIAA